METETKTTKHQTTSARPRLPKGERRVRFADTMGMELVSIFLFDLLNNYVNFYNNSIQQANHSNQNSNCRQQQNQYLLNNEIPPPAIKTPSYTHQHQRLPTTSVLKPTSSYCSTTPSLISSPEKLPQESSSSSPYNHYHQNNQYNNNHHHHHERSSTTSYQRKPTLIRDEQPIQSRLTNDFNKLNLSSHSTTTTTLATHYQQSQQQLKQQQPQQQQIFKCEFAQPISLISFRERVKLNKVQLETCNIRIAPDQRQTNQASSHHQQQQQQRASPNQNKTNISINPPSSTISQTHSSAQPQAEQHLQSTLDSSLNLCAEQVIINCTIRVLNLSYDKLVSIRYTFDEWHTFREMGADYKPGSNDGWSDRFGVSFTIDCKSLKQGSGNNQNKTPSPTNTICPYNNSIHLPSSPKPMATQRRIIFAVKYAVNDARDVYWDNNGGQNYVINVAENATF